MFLVVVISLRSLIVPFFFSSRRRHTMSKRDWSSDVCSSDLNALPTKLIIAEERKGYSRAVREGMQVLSAPYLLCIDSDGQCDPADFSDFWKNRNTHDVILGWRVHRVDAGWRRFLSRTFYFLWQLFYHVPVHDPSCPYMLARKEVIDEISPQMGDMEQGFWWEFVARVHRRGFSILELL